MRPPRAVPGVHAAGRRIVAIACWSLSLCTISRLNAGCGWRCTINQEVTVATLLGPLQYDDLRQEPYYTALPRRRRASPARPAEGFNLVQCGRRSRPPLPVRLPRPSPEPRCSTSPVVGGAGSGETGSPPSLLPFGRRARRRRQGPGLPPRGRGRAWAGMAGGLAQTQMTQFLDHISRWGARCTSPELADGTVVEYRRTWSRTLWVDWGPGRTATASPRPPRAGAGGAERQPVGRPGWRQRPPHPRHHGTVPAAVPAALHPPAALD